KNPPTAAELGVLLLTGGTMTGEISRTLAGTWIAGKDNAMLNLTCSDSNYASAVRARGSSQTFTLGVLGNSQFGFYRYNNTETVNRTNSAFYMDSSGNMTATGNITSPSFIGNASSATVLASTRTINGTNFNGSGNITTANWGTARTITIGNTGKSVNGAGNVSWTATEMGVVRGTNNTNVGLDSNENYIGYITNALMGQADGALYQQAFSSVWKHQIQGDYRTGRISVRGKNNGTWQAWRSVYDSVYRPTATDVGLGNVPNTVHTAAATASTVVLRDSEADINVRLVRSNFQNDNYMNGAIGFRTNNGTDNYMRYCSEPAAVRTWLGVSTPGSDPAYVKRAGDTMTGTLTGKHITATGTGNDYHTGGFEVCGNGAANTVFPTYGLHQPGLFACSIQARSGTDIRFYAQGAGTYTDITARSIYANGTFTSTASGITSRFGALNASHTNFETNAGSFHFNKDTKIQGNIYCGPSYNQLVWSTNNLVFGTGATNMATGNHTHTWAVNKAGDTMTGALKVSSATGLAANAPTQLGLNVLSSTSSMRVLSNTDNSDVDEPVIIASRKGLTDDPLDGLAVGHDYIKFQGKDLVTKDDLPKDEGGSDNGPIGSIFPYVGAVIPLGYLLCDGRTIARADYPELYDLIGDRIPDLRGEFIRGLDNGRGVDAGRTMGSMQGDSIRNITGEFGNIGSAGNRSFPIGLRNAGGAFFKSGETSKDVGDIDTLQNFILDSNASINFDASLVVPTANENRPRNVAYNYIIKASYLTSEVIPITPATELNNKIETNYNNQKVLDKSILGTSNDGYIQDDTIKIVGNHYTDKVNGKGYFCIKSGSNVNTIEFFQPMNIRDSNALWETSTNTSGTAYKYQDGTLIFRPTIKSNDVVGSFPIPFKRIDCVGGSFTSSNTDVTDECASVFYIHQTTWQNNLTKFHISGTQMSGFGTIDYTSHNFVNNVAFIGRWK
ncbi:MAG: tail fiber protein, partial [Fusobacteriaceae bacterium]